MADYIPTGNPEDNMRGIAKQIRDEFLLLQMAVNSKTNKDSVILAATEAQGTTVNDYVLTVSPAITAYTTNSSVTFIATHTNTGACTIKISALLPKTLKDVDGLPLEAGDIENGSVVSAFYNGADFFLTSGNDKVSRSGDTYTGNHNMTGANVTVATQSGGDNSQKAASTAFVGAGLALKANTTYVDSGLALKANINSPALTGTPTTPTPMQGDNSTKIANTAYVDTGLATKASISYVDSGLSTKASITYVDTGLALKANINSPALTGVPTTPTAPVSATGTQIASVDFVRALSTSASGSTGINVKDYGAKGDGVTDDVAAINAAINYANSLPSGGTVVFPAGVYLVGAVNVLLKSNVILWLYGAILKLKDGSAVHNIRIAASATKCGVYGGEIDGNKANCPAGGDGINTFLIGTGQTYVTIRDVYIHDCKLNGIFMSGVSEAVPIKFVTINGCTVQNNDTHGIISSFIEEYACTGNTVSNNVGVCIGNISTTSAKYCVISDNVVTAHASGTNTNISFLGSLNRQLTISGNVSKLGVSHGIAIGGKDIVVSNNMIYDPGQNGILCQANSAAVSNNVVMSGNLVDSAGASGILADKTNEFTIIGNTVANNTSHGIILETTCSNGSFSDNTVKSNGIYGIGIITSNHISITGNTSIANTSHGIFLQDSTDCTVTGNVFSGNSGQPFVLWGTSDYNIVSGNDFRGNTTDVPYIIGVNTVWDGNLVNATNSLASAATLTLLTYTDFITITGTTNITSIAASWNKRTVTLQFSGVLTVVKGSNLLIASDLVTAANDTITLVCNGTSWFEVSRSSAAAAGGSTQTLLQTFTSPGGTAEWEILPTIIDNRYDIYEFVFHSFVATTSGSLGTYFKAGGAYITTATYWTHTSASAYSFGDLWPPSVLLGANSCYAGTIRFYTPWSTAFKKYCYAAITTSQDAGTVSTSPTEGKLSNSSLLALQGFKLANIYSSAITGIVSAGAVGKWYGLK